MSIKKRNKNEDKWSSFDLLATLRSLDMRKLDKFLRINKYSEITRYLIYLAIPGIILSIFSIFFTFLWTITWFYTFIVVIILGFLFARPGKRYNFWIPVGFFIILAFVPSDYSQALLGLETVEGIEGDGTTDPQDIPQNPEIEIDGGADTTTDLKVTLHLSCQYAQEMKISVNEAPGLLDPWVQYQRYYTQKLYIRQGAHTQAREFRIYAKFRNNLGQSEVVSAKIFYDPQENQSLVIPAKDYLDKIEKLSENPLDDIDQYITNFVDVLNWILFLGIVAYGGSTVADAWKLDVGKIAQKIATIALTIVIITFIYTLFQAVDITIRTIWDTVGDAWGNLMEAINLASLNQQTGEVVVTYKSVTNGLFSYIPLFFPLALLGFAWGLKKTDFESMLLAKTATEKNTIEVKRTEYDLGATVALLAVITYVLAYYLLTTTPEVTINPLVTLVLYAGAGLILLLIIIKLPILNQYVDIYDTIWSFMKWTILGLFILFAWFKVFQPVMYSLNLIDYETSLLTLSQGASIFEIDFFKQLFLVAAPETLIFQIAFIGIGNRIYFRLGRGRILEKEEERKRELIQELDRKQALIILNENDSREEILLKLANYIRLDRKIENLEREIAEEQITSLPKSYFLLPMIISSFIGSFMFSWWHAFRRIGGDFAAFIEWWRNPLLGMTYFGAGFLLCLVAFFSWPAAIMVHTLNNLIALMLSGG